MASEKGGSSSLENEKQQSWAGFLGDFPLPFAGMKDVVPANVPSLNVGPDEVPANVPPLNVGTDEVPTNVPSLNVGPATETVAMVGTSIECIQNVGATSMIEEQQEKDPTPPKVPPGLSFL